MFAANIWAADDVVQITKVKIRLKPCAHCRRSAAASDVVIEAVGRPEAWEWSTDMVRKGGTVNFFGGCAPEPRSASIRTTSLFSSDVESDFPSHSRNRATGVCADHGERFMSADYITGEAPLSRLQSVFRHMMNRNGDIKTAIIPGS